MSGSATTGDYNDKVKGIWESLSSQEGKRWARPEEPVLHKLEDEKSEPYVFFHNTNFRLSRKYINIEKVKLLREQALECVRTAGHARHHKCLEIHKRFQAAVRVSSNVDRGPLARKRDVGFIYHTNKMRELQEEADKHNVEWPFK